MLVERLKFGKYFLIFFEFGTRSRLMTTLAVLLSGRVLYKSTNSITSVIIVNHKIIHYLASFFLFALVTIL